MDIVTIIIESLSIFFSCFGIMDRAGRSIFEHRIEERLAKIQEQLIILETSMSNVLDILCSEDSDSELDEEEVKRLKIN